MSPTASLLPVEIHLPAILLAIRSSSLVVLQAQPGSGKTTRIPIALAGEASGQVWILEPRRLAATLAAQYIAEQIGETCGGRIGYRVRHESLVSPETKVLFLTEGMFLRLLQSNPNLDGVSHLVIDEFHERHLQTDLAFTLARFLQASKRPDLKLIIMSATLDIEAFSTQFPEAPVFDVDGRSHPVACKYLGRDNNESIVDAAVRGIDAMANTLEAGNILAFLPGTSEIMRVCEKLRLKQLGEWKIFALTASLQSSVRQKMFSSDGQRKIIVATNVAESSVTLPNIGGVVDTGVAKVPGHAAWSGLPTLELKRVPQSSCIQRQGRAGRTRPGVCFRMFSENDFLARDAFLPAEIERLDLCETVLELCRFAETGHISDPLNLDTWTWLSPPREDLWDQATTLLTDMGAIAAGRLTTKGRAMCIWPFHPRLAAIVVEGVDHGHGFAALAAACLINEKGIFSFESTKSLAVACDVTAQLQAWQENAPHHLFDFGARQRFERDLHSLRRLLPVEQRNGGPIPDLTPMLFAGFFDRIARRRVVEKSVRQQGVDVTFNFCLGRGGRLSPRTQVLGAEYMICLDVAEDPAARTAATGSYIHLASTIDRDWLLDSESQLLNEMTQYRWIENGQRVDGYHTVKYGQLILKEAKSEQALGASELLATMLGQKWPGPFTDDDALVRHNGKVSALRLVGLGGDLPHFSGELFQLLLEVICDNKRSFAEISRRSLREYLEDQMSYEQVCLLRHLTPDQLVLANGRTLPLRFAASGEVWVTGFVQDFFGIAEPLSIAQGRIMVKVEMLGPHKRPVQVTSELGLFWSSGYPALAKELRGRYPRHHWPEAPQSSPPILTKSKLPK